MAGQKEYYSRRMEVWGQLRMLKKGRLHERTKRKKD